MADYGSWRPGEEERRRDAGRMEEGICKREGDEGEGMSAPRERKEEEEEEGKKDAMKDSGTRFEGNADF